MLFRSDLTQIWEIPLWPVAAVMVLCSLVMLVALAIQWIRAVRIAAGAETAGDAGPLSGADRG